MAIRKKEIENKIADYYKVVAKKYPVKKILLFGSYAYGKPNKDSDIDIAVVLDLPLKSDRIQITADLFHFTRSVDVLLEPKCIFYKEYLSPAKGSILEFIVSNAKTIVG